MAFSMGVGEGLRRALIPVIDRTAPLRGRLAQAGGVLPLGKFPEAEIDYYLHKLSTARTLSPEPRGNPRAATEAFAIRRACASGRLSRTVVVGGLCGSVALSAAVELREWHHDNVGNRVKLFVVLGNESEENGTEFVPHTNRTRWRTFTGRLAAPERGGWFVPQRRGDVLIFDTNVVHRGRYSGSERVILQVEFSSIFKKPGSVRALRRYFRSRLEQRYGAAE